MDSAAVSPMMQALNNQALDRAREKIKKKFVETSSLDDISSMRNELQNRLSEADAKLKTAVQGKLDSLKRAVDLMEESSGKLEKFTSSIDQVDARIAQTNTAISKYPNVKRVHYALDNLRKVISQVEFFSDIPNRVAELRSELHAPGKLKKVYLDCLQLQAWRSALMKELQASREKHLNAEKHAQQGGGQMPPVPRKNRVASQAQEYSEDMYVTIIGVVGSHLETVLDLSREVRNRLWGNIERLFDLANRSPSDLVETFEIIEMHQEYVNRRMIRARELRAARGAPAGPNDEINARELGGGLDEGVLGVDVRKESIERLKRNLDEKVEGRFIMIAQAHLGEEEESDDDEAAGEEDGPPKVSKVTKTLNSANGMIGIMTEFKNEVSVCIPPSFDSMSLFLDAFEARLSPRIFDLVENPANLEVADMMQLIHWLEYYVEQLSVFGESNRNCCLEFLRVAQDLKHEYLHRIKSQVMGWFGNIKNQKIELGKSSDGTLITSMPEDMFNVIHMQMSVAREKLPGEHLKDVVNACLQTLREVQRQSYDSMAAEWKQMDVEMLCATINDMYRMQGKSQEFSEVVISCVSQPDDRDMLLEMLGAVSDEYERLAIKAVGFLAKLVLQDLQEVVFEKLFILEWEQASTNGVCGIICATLQDYFKDIEEWLPVEFYCRLTLCCLRTVVHQYCMALRKRVSFHLAFQFSNELSAARHMMSDADTIRQFFKGYIDCLIDAGMEVIETPDDGDVAPEEAALDELLEPISQLARVVSATHISGAMDDVRSLCIRWRRDGLKLVHSAISANPSMDKAERQECIDMATKACDVLEDAGRLRKRTSMVDDDIIGDSVDSGYMENAYGALKKSMSGVVGGGSKGDASSTSKWSKVRLLTKDIIGGNAG